MLAGPEELMTDEQIDQFIEQVIGRRTGKGSRARARVEEGHVMDQSPHTTTASTRIEESPSPPETPEPDQRPDPHGQLKPHVLLWDPEDLDSVTDEQIMGFIRESVRRNRKG